MKMAERIKSPMFTNFVSIVLLQGTNFLLHFLSFPYLFRVLEVERYGLISFGYVFIQYFVMLSDFGFGLSATKYISQHQSDKAKVNTYLNSAMVGRFCLVCLSLLILLALIAFVPKFHLEAKFYLLYFGIVLGNFMFPIWFFQGMERMKFITIFNMVAKSLSLLPMFIFISQPSQYIYVPVCYSTGYLIAGFVSLYFIYSRFGMNWFIPAFKEIRFAFTDSANYFLSRISLSLFSSSNTFVMGLVCGNTITGYYAAAEKLYQAYGQLIDPFSKVLFPYMTRTRDTKFFKKTFLYIVIANTALVGLALLFSGFIIQFIYNPDSSYVVNVFRILICAAFFSIPHMLIGYPFIAAMGHPHFANWTVVFTSCFHVAVLGILLIANGISIYSVSILVVCSEILLFSLRVYGIKKYKLFSIGKQNE
jgi:PST family polysaccharide transporter